MTNRLTRLIGLGVSFVLCLMASASFAYSVYDVEISRDLYGNLNQNTIPTIGTYCCGPAATTNSFIYLQNEYSSIYGNKLVHAQTSDLNHDGQVNTYDDMMATTTLLASDAYMRTVTRVYTYHDDLIWAKKKYIDENAPGQTVYVAQDYWSWTNPQRTKPSFVDSVTPTWNFLYSELCRHSEIEILFTWNTGGHFVSLSSLHWADVNSDGVIQQSENATIDYMNPWTGAWGQSKLWQSNGTLYTDYATNAWISMAAAGRPVPEPGAILPMLFALSGVVAAVRRRCV